MRVDKDLRLPAGKGQRLPAGLHLALEIPVPVEIKEVVVETAAGPALSVLGRQGLGARSHASILPVKIHETVPSIRILKRIDNHHQFFEQLPGLFPQVGKEMVGRQQTRIRSR